jgi:hypothetical protein
MTTSYLQCQSEVCFDGDMGAVSTQSHNILYTVAKYMVS